MSEAFIGELRLMSFVFPPKGWLPCNGQLLPINQNQALFSLLGVTYGGDGRTNFALPDLRGRTPISTGSWRQGTPVGEEFHTLSVSELPTHQHYVLATQQAAAQAAPAALAAAGNLYADARDLTAIHPATVTNAGGGAPHENRHPALVLNWCIATVGVFPTRS